MAKTEHGGNPINEENRVELWWVSTYSLTYLLTGGRERKVAKHLRERFPVYMYTVYDKRARVTLANSAEQRKNTRKFHFSFLLFFSFLIFLYFSALVERISYRTSFLGLKKHYVSTSFPLTLPCAAAS